MIGRKGVEGLPLKYLVIALVGAITVGIALQMTGVLRKGVMTGMGVMNQSLTRKVKKSAGYKTETVPKFGVDWHFYDIGNLTISNICNTGVGSDLNLTEVRATYLGNTEKWTGNLSLGNDEGEKLCTGTLTTLDLSDKGDQETGDQISITLSVGYIKTYENGTLKENETFSHGILEGEVEAR